MKNKKSTFQKIAIIVVLLVFLSIVLIEFIFSPLQNGLRYAVYFYVKELPYRIWLTYEMRSNLSSVKKSMKSFLEKKYNRSFVIGEGGLGFSSISMYYWAEACLKDNPEIKFKINSSYFSFTKRNYKKGKVLNFFYDGFYTAIFELHTHDFLRYLKKSYPDINIKFILKFITGNKKDLKTLNLLKIKDKTKIPKFPSSVYLNIGFYINSKNFDKKKEARELTKVLNKYFSKHKINKYIIICRYFPKKLKWEIKRKWRAIKFESQPRESIESYYQDGHLINSFILCNFEGPAKEIKSENILNSFMYK